MPDKPVRKSYFATIFCFADPIIYWYSQNQTVVGITHITAAPTQPAKIYPSLPTRSI